MIATMFFDCRCNYAGLPQPMKPQTYTFETYEDLFKVFDMWPNIQWVIEDKLDGIRARKWNGRMWSNSGIQIKNKAIQASYTSLKDGSDGELRLMRSDGKPAPLNETAKIVNSANADASHILYTVYDDFVGGNKPYLSRMRDYHMGVSSDAFLDVPFNILSYDLLPYEREALEVELRWRLDDADKAGAEGIILRPANSLYHYGRATITNPVLLRYKFWEDVEGRIIEIGPRKTNINIAECDEYGRTKRSHSKDGMVETETMGYLKVELPDGRIARIGTGFSDSDRLWFWQNKKTLVAKDTIVMFAILKHGNKDLGRHARYRCIREDVSWKQLSPR